MVEKTKETRKVLVTGSGGMLGIDLCKALSEAYKVFGLDSKKTLDYGPGVAEYLQCDITDKKEVNAAFTAADPDVIIHTAAWTDVDGCEREPDKAEDINSRGTGNIISWVANKAIPLVYLSTDFVFDGNKNILYTEDSPTNPLSVYGKTKLDGERKVSTLEKYAIIRTSWLYGSNGKNFVDTIVKKAETPGPLNVVDDQIGSPTYTKDLAKAINRLLCISGMWAKHIFHISNKGTVSWFEYAKEVLKISGIGNTTVIPIKSHELDRPAKRPVFSGLDTRRFEKMAGYSLRSWQEALREYIEEKVDRGIRLRSIG